MVVADGARARGAGIVSEVVEAGGCDAAEAAVAGGWRFHVTEPIGIRSTFVVEGLY